MDCDIRRSVVPTSPPVTQARDIPVRSAGDERDAGAGGYVGVQDILALSRLAFGMGRDA